MTVYVDDLMACLPNPRWPWTRVSHMVSPDTEELHRFAARIGLKRAWFQGGGALPHYDLTPGVRARAVRLGAVQVPREEWIAVFGPIRDAWVQSRRPAEAKKE